MIEKHLALSCFTLEQPFSAHYSLHHDHPELLHLIDKNHDVYEFALTDPELYHKIDGGGELKQLRKVGSLCFMLYHNGCFIARRNSQQLHSHEGIAQMEMLETAHGLLVVLRSSSFYGKNELELQMGFISPMGEQLDIKFGRVRLEEEAAEHDHFQKYVSQLGGTQYRVEKLFNRCCLIVDNHGEKSIFRLNYDVLTPNDSTVKFRKLEFELHQDYSVSSSFRDFLLIHSATQSFLLDSQHERIVLLKDLAVTADTDYVIYNSFAIVVTGSCLTVFETIKGNRMAEISIDGILEQFEEGSTIILKEELQKEVRYGLLFDTLTPKLTHFYLLDKEKLSLFHFNINKLLERGFIKTIKENLQTLENDDEKYHENIMKTLNFRAKKLEALEKYLLEDLKTGNFNNTLRFLANEQTIYVLNDGLSLLYHALMGNITKLTAAPSAPELEREIVRICHRLITESNYENQIANGLHILNGIYTNFRKHEHSEALEKNKEAYVRLLETNRVAKLLKNEKKKKLFELAYELALKVKGYKYLEGLDARHK